MPTNRLPVALALLAAAAVLACSPARRSDDDDATTDAPDAGTVTPAPDAGRPHDDGAPDGGTSSNPPESCGSLAWSSSAACMTCLDGACCQELLACDDDTACRSFLDCAVACGQGNSSCIQQCADGNPDGAAATNALVSCQNASCQADCSPTAICDSGFTSSKPACAQCLTASCCEPLKTCKDDTTCVACLTGQQSGSACDADAAFAAAGACVSGSCGSDCQ